jgi:hypothetical protein
VASFLTHCCWSWSCKGYKVHRSEVVTFLTTTNFPSSLINLQISTCKLKRIDSRIFNLKKLEVLNLSDNCIVDVSTDFGKFKTLRELLLNNNAICTLTHCCWSWSCKGYKVHRSEVVTFLTGYNSSLKHSAWE